MSDRDLVAVCESDDELLPEDVRVPDAVKLPVRDDVCVPDALAVNVAEVVGRTERELLWDDDDDGDNDEDALGDGDAELVTDVELVADPLDVCVPCVADGDALDARVTDRVADGTAVTDGVAARNARGANVTARHTPSIGPDDRD